MRGAAAAAAAVAAARRYPSHTIVERRESKFSIFLLAVTPPGPSGGHCLTAREAHNAFRVFPGNYSCMESSACAERVFGTPSLAANILCRLATCPAALGLVSCVNTTLRAAANGDGEAAWRAACEARFPSSVVARAALRDTTVFSWRTHFCGRMKALQPPVRTSRRSGRSLDGLVLCVEVSVGGAVAFSCCLPASDALGDGPSGGSLAEEDEDTGADEHLYRFPNLLSPAPVSLTSKDLDAQLRAYAWLQRPDGKQTALLVGDERFVHYTTLQWRGRGLPTAYAFGGRPTTVLVWLSLKLWALDQTGLGLQPTHWSGGWRPRPAATSLRLTKLRPRWCYMTVDVEEPYEARELSAFVRGVVRPENMVCAALDAAPPPQARWV